MRLALVLACILIVACGAEVGPFVPHAAQRCAADPDCPDGFVCRFPSPGARAVCMHGVQDDYPGDPTPRSYSL